jgi:hypothetical protein
MKCQLPVVTPSSLLHHDEDNKDHSKTPSHFLCRAHDGLRPIVVIAEATGLDEPRDRECKNKYNNKGKKKKQKETPTQQAPPYVPENACKPSPSSTFATS